MKLSSLTVEDVFDYLRVDAPDIDDAEYKSVTNMLLSAKAYIRSYTGLTDEECDSYEDLTQAALILCQDYYDNRSMYISNSQSLVNKAVTSILGLYQINLL